MAAVFIALVMFALGVASWAGLGWLLLNLPPEQPFAVAALYVLAFGGIANTTALLSWLATRPRTVDGELRTPATYAGHAMLLAIIALFGLWLQSLRMLTPMVAALLAGLYVFLEAALLFGTRGAVDVEVEPRVTSVG